MSEMSYKDCARLLTAQDNILIISHKNPDGDTLGSCGAICSALRRVGKNAYLYPNPQINNKFMPYLKEFIAPDDFKADYIMAVDVATPGLFVNGFEGDVQLCIDHHPTNTHYARRSFIKDDRSSCGEIILELIKALADKPTAQEATLLYIALTTDTGCYQYGNTGARTLASGAELVRLGADIDEVNLKFFRKVSRERIMLEGMIYSQLKFYRAGKICIAKITKDMIASCGAKEEDLDDLAGLPGRVEGTVLSITIKENDEGGSKISVRSNHEVSASKICAVLGGGGHEMAAGCALDCSVDRAEEMLLAVIDEVWK